VFFLSLFVIIFNIHIGMEAGGRCWLHEFTWLCNQLLFSLILRETGAVKLLINRGQRIDEEKYSCQMNKKYSMKCCNLLLAKLGNLALQELHIFRQGGLGIVKSLALVQPSQATRLSVLLLPPPGETGNESNNEDNEEASQNSEPDSLLLKHGRESQKDERSEEEDTNDVDNWNKLGSAGGPSKCPGSLEWNLAHERKRVPDDDAGNVEEQVCKGN
jgi:hypothetical protein